MERTEIESLGEFGLIQHLTQNNETRQASTMLSVGDDAAVIDHFGKQTVITTDMLIEGIHFDLMYTPLKHLGYKAVAVNVSDLCAMMATPSHITMSVAFSNRFSVEALDEFYEGVYAACDKYNVDLVGGDTCTSPKGFIISVTAVGEVSNSNFVTRDKAQVNDLICATGDLGAAYIGRQLLEREKRIFLENPKIQPDLQQKEHVIGKILKPEARVDVVEWLQENKILPTSMMDISDGLSSDILHICRQSNVGCVIYDEKLPIHNQTKEMAMEFGLSGTSCALNGGEDYELLFTIPQADYEKIVLSEKISVIGYITKLEEGTNLITQQGNKHKLVAQGWQAF
jgi:thiamine-monophosphate kinase